MTHDALKQPEQSPIPGVTLVSARRAAEVLGLSPRTLANWRWRGGECGPRFVKLGRAIRYDLQELLAFIEQNRVSSTSEADGDR
jgi:hypothetical protein